MTTPEQETLLSLSDDPATAKILTEIWNQINGEPLMAARMMRAFKGALHVIDETLTELPAQWKRLDAEMVNADLRRAEFTNDLRKFRSDTTAELAAATKDIAELDKFFKLMNDDAFLNKANRLLELCEKLNKAKRDGTLDFVKKMLTE